MAGVASHSTAWSIGKAWSKIQLQRYSYWSRRHQRATYNFLAAQFALCLRVQFMALPRSLGFSLHFDPRCETDTNTDTNNDPSLPGDFNALVSVSFFPVVSLIPVQRVDF
jgi:hypothetical protein